MLLLNPYRFGGPPFSPDDLSDLVAWYDAQDAGTISTSGSDVTQWDDKSGNARHLTPINTTDRPTETTVNSRNMIQFDAANDEHLRSTDSGFQFGSGSFTIFVVYRTSDNSQAVVVGKGDSNSRYNIQVNGGAVAGRLQAGINDTLNNFSNIFDTAVDYSDGTVRIAMCRFDNPNDDWQLYDDTDASSPLAENTSYTTSGNINPTPPFFVSGFDTGPGAGSWLPFDGEVGEVLVYSQALNSSDRASVMDYLKARWAI